MALFPRLSTGSVAQYPAARTVQHRTTIIQYTDGTEQRISSRSAPIVRWIIRLDQLTDREAHDVLTFFAQVRGRAEQFEFEDPWSGTMFPHCRFEQDDFTVDYTGETGSRTTLAIRSTD